MGHDGDLQRFSRPWLFMDRWIGRERPCSARFRSFSIFFPPVSYAAELCTCTHDHQRGSSDAPNASRIRVGWNAWEGPACQDVPLNRNRLRLNRSSARPPLFVPSFRPYLERGIRSRTVSVILSVSTPFLIKIRLWKRVNFSIKNIWKVVFSIWYSMKKESFRRCFPDFKCENPVSR